MQACRALICSGTNCMARQPCNACIVPQGKQRDMLQREQGRAEEYTNQVELLRATLAKSATELAQKAVENKSARVNLDAKRQKLDAARKKFVAVKRKLETEFGQLDTLELKVGYCVWM